jgi:uncharacterized protein (DUF302 family)
MRIFLSFLSGLLISSSVAAEGTVQVKSQHSVAVTADKLETVLKNKGMTVFNRIDHSAGAAGVDIELRPTELIIFGNPKVGSPLMLCAQAAAIDLPQKALIHEDEKGDVWLTYNDPAYLKGRHNIEGCDQALQKVSGALAKFSKVATE